MNPCIPSGTRPVKMPTNQAASTANQTAMPQSSEPDRSAGSTRKSRKKTVSRLRSRSSVTTRWIGCGAGRVGLEDGELLGHQGSLAEGPVPLRRR